MYTLKAHCISTCRGMKHARATFLRHPVDFARRPGMTVQPRQCPFHFELSLASRMQQQMYPHECRGSWEQAPIEYVRGPEARDYLNLHNALSAHGLSMEVAIQGIEIEGSFLPHPMVDDTFDDPVYSLDRCGSPCVSVSHGVSSTRAPPADASELVVALVPRPMKWAFAVHATTHEDVFGVLVKDGLVKIPKHMFWDGEVESDVISISSDDFPDATATAMAESRTRKKYFLGVGIEAQAVLYALRGWESTVPDTGLGCPALRMSGYITDKDVVVFRDIEPVSVSPPIITS